MTCGLSNTTGILRKKCGLLVLVTPFLSGVLPPKKIMDPPQRNDKLITENDNRQEPRGHLKRLIYDEFKLQRTGRSSYI